MEERTDKGTGVHFIAYSSVNQFSFFRLNIGDQYTNQIPKFKRQNKSMREKIKVKNEPESPKGRENIRFVKILVFRYLKNACLNTMTYKPLTFGQF